MPLSAHSRGRLQATIAGGLTATGWLIRGGRVMAVAAVTTGILALLAWFLPQAFAPIQRSLDGVARGVTKAASWIVLGMVYFLFFTPLRVILGLLGKDALRLRRSQPLPATFLQTLPAAAPGRFDRLF